MCNDLVYKIKQICKLNRQLKIKDNYEKEFNTKRKYNLSNK